MALLGALLPVLTTNTALLGGAQSGSGSVSVGAFGRNSRPAVRFLDGRAMLVPLSAAVSTIWVNTAINPGTFVTSSRLLWSLVGSNTYRQFGVGWNSTGTLTVEQFIGDFSRTILGSIIINPAVDHVLDVKVLVHASAGTVDVYVDGNATAALSLTGLNTQRDNTSITAVMAGWGEGVGFTGDVQYMEHLLAMSETDTGDGFHGRLGSVVMDPQRPDGAGDQTTGTPSAGANWQCADDTDADSGADNVAFNAAGGDRYTLTNVGFTVGDTKGVIVAALCSKDDAGTVTGRTQIKSGATVATGATVSIASTDAYLIQAYGTDPATAAAFTPAGLNSLSAGPERVS